MVREASSILWAPEVLTDSVSVVRQLKYQKLFDELVTIAPEIVDELAVRGPLGSPALAEMVLPFSQ